MQVLPTTDKSLVPEDAKVGAEAHRAARTLQDKGFYTHVSKQSDFDSAEKTKG
jgi:hypothetical protein